MEKLRKAREEVAIMAVMLLVTILLFVWIIPSYVPVPLAARGQSFTPRTFLYVLATVLGIASAWGLIQNVIDLMKVKRELTENPEEADKKPEKRWTWNYAIPYVIFLVIVAYGFMISKIGFIISSAIVIPVVLFIIGCKKWNYYVIVYIFSAIMYCIFRFVLHIQLP